MSITFLTKTTLVNKYISNDILKEWSKATLDFLYPGLEIQNKDYPDVRSFLQHLEYVGVNSFSFSRIIDIVQGCCYPREEKCWITLLIYLLENNYYKKEDKDILASVILPLKQSVNSPISFHRMFDPSNELKDFYAARGDKKGNMVLYYLPVHNQYAREVYHQMIDRRSLLRRKKDLESFAILLNSFTDFGDFTPARFTDEWFWRFVGEITEVAHDGQRTAFIYILVDYYREIVDKWNTIEQFLPSDTLSENLLNSAKFPYIIEQNFDSYERLVLIPNDLDVKGDYVVSLPVANATLLKLLKGFGLSEGHIVGHVSFSRFSNHIEDYLCDGGYKIESIESFDNEDLFWCVFNKCSSTKETNSHFTEREVFIRFYRYILKTNSNIPFFQSAKLISKSLINTSKVIGLLDVDRYSIHRYVTAMDAPDDDKIILLVDNFHQYDVGLLNEDYIVLDFSRVKDGYYRRLVKQYVFESEKRIANKTIRSRLLIMMENLPDSIAIPNSQWKTILTADDGYRIRLSLERRLTNNATGKFSVKSLQFALHLASRFFRWASMNGLVIKDSLFFVYFTADYKVSQKYKKDTIGARSMSEQDVMALGSALYDASKSEHRSMIVFLIFLVHLQTVIRHGDICKLAISDIHTTYKKNVFQISTYSKTGRRFGKEEQYTIDSSTLAILKYAISITEPLRNDSKINPAYRDYIFLVSTHNGIKPISDTAYSRIIKETCLKNNIDGYTAKNIRKTRMNYIWEFDSKTNSGGWILKHQTHHKDPSVTFGNYADRYRANIIGQVLGFNIGDKFEIKEAESKVVGKIPARYNAPKYDTDQNLGRCTNTSSKCTGEVYLPCLLCKQFKTTPEFRSAFVAELNTIDKAIAAIDDIQHDIDDLVVKRRLISNYLVAIDNFKKSHE